MPSANVHACWLEGFLTAELDKAGLAGAALAVLRDGEVCEAVAGVRDVESDQAVEPGDFFQIASITKVLIATLAMRLVDEGRIKLDEPVKTYLPEFELAEPGATNTVTMRHLLTHTSGIDGDGFVELGTGDEALSSYMNYVASIDMLHEPGARVAYCNVGFMIAARVVEVVTKLPWRDALRRYVLDPTGLHNATLLPSEAKSRNDPRGHYPDPKDTSKLIRQQSIYELPVSCGPMGTTLAMSATNLMSFVQTHLACGQSASGQRVLSEASVREMVTAQAELPEGAAVGATHWGLGWCLYDWNGTQVIGHDGDTGGFLSYLRVEPNSKTAAVLLVNSANANGFCHNVFSEVFDRFAGICPPLIPKRVKAPKDLNLKRYIGLYGRLGCAMQVSDEDGRLVLRMGESHAQILGQPGDEIVRAHGDIFHCWRGSQALPQRLQFGDFDAEGRAGSVFSGYRLCLRHNSVGDQNRTLETPKGQHQ